MNNSEFLGSAGDPIQPRTVTHENLQDALDVGYAVFMMTEERENIRTTFANFTGGKYSYEDMWEGPVTLIEYAVFYQTGAPVAIGGLYHMEGDAPDDYRLGWMGVLKEYRRSGIGDQVMNYVEQLARARGAYRLSLYTPDVEQYAPAHRFYESRGFTVDESRHLTLSFELGGNVIQVRQRFYIKDL